MKVGQHVKAGQILGRLDPTDAAAAVTEAESSLKTAQANLEQTLTGETAAQRASDALSVRQARAQITTAQLRSARRDDVRRQQHAARTPSRRPPR